MWGINPTLDTKWDPPFGIPHKHLTATVGYYRPNKLDSDYIMSRESENPYISGLQKAIEDFKKNI
jgi:hypothetical protein